MTSSPFERQLTEPESTERRTTTSTARMSDGPQQYPPGPSFLDHDRPSVRLVELPAWLQAFAASTGEPSIDRPDELELDVTSEAVMRDDDKPAPQPDPTQELAVKPAPQAAPNFSTSFISEDDLPEWLRSIAPDEQESAGAEALLLGQTESSGQVAVPNVTRAWTTSSDARGVDESSSIFALVASQPTHGPLPVGEAAAPAGTPGRRARGTSHAPAEGAGHYGSDVLPPVVDGIGVEGRPESVTAAGNETPVRGRFPVLPIAVAAILLLALVLVALQLFVF